MCEAIPCHTISVGCKPAEHINIYNFHILRLFGLKTFSFSFACVQKFSIRTYLSKHNTVSKIQPIRHRHIYLVAPCIFSGQQFYMYLFKRIRWHQSVKWNATQIEMKDEQSLSACTSPGKEIARDVFLPQIKTNPKKWTKIKLKEKFLIYENWM